MDNAAASARASADAPCGPDPSGTAFTWPVRVYYEDTDAAGVVYYANYLRFFERCRTEWMRALGFGQHDLARQTGIVFVVAAAELRYLRPARLDDALTIDARITELRAGSVVFTQQARRDGAVLCEGRVKVACVDAQSLRPVRIPEAIAAALPSVSTQA